MPFAGLVYGTFFCIAFAWITLASVWKSVSLHFTCVVVTAPKSVEVASLLLRRVP